MKSWHHITGFIFLHNLKLVFKNKVTTKIKAVNSSIQFGCSAMSNSLKPHGLQHTKLPCPSPTPRACSDSCTSSQWFHPTISSSVVHFSSCLQSFPASGSFPKSQLFASGGQSIAVSASASVLPMNIQDWFSLGWTGFIFLQSKLCHKLITNLFIVFLLI